MRRIFTPIDLGPLTLPNRIVMPAMHMNYTMDGFMNEQFIAFYRRRAEGGCGLIQIGGCPVEAKAGSEFMIGINDDKFLPGLMKFSEAIHKAGSRCGLQLYHAGRYTYRVFLNGEPAPSASETLSGLTKEMSREMTKEDIKETIRDFAVCAERAKRAGFDAVEVIASAGYLINQFLSPLTNFRTDDYGGTLENRMRFGLEVIAAVREAIGKDTALTVRLAGNDFVKGSNTNKENALFAKAAAEQCGVQMFNVTGGWHESNIPQITAALPRGGYAYLARNVKQLVKVPVAASNRIISPDLAERFLKEGWCDMISLGRALIADPDWPLKAREGRDLDILPCVSCNQECLDNVFQLKPVGCLMNPEAGREEQPLQRTAQPKDVLVIGGGPAGLVAATTAARRGHRVTLTEAKPQCGGQLFAASAAPSKDEFARIAPTWEHQARLAGVKIETRIEMTKEDVTRRKPDLVILATGAKLARPPIPGLDHPSVVSAIDLLEGKVTVGERVVVLGGGPVGVEAALFVAEIGSIDPQTAAFLLKHEAETPEIIRDLLWRGHKSVTLVEMLPKIGMGIGKSTRWVALKELAAMGVQSLTETKATGIEDGGVRVATPQGERLLPADTVVLATGMTAYKPLGGIEKELGAESVVTVGDAERVADAAKAIREAYLKTRSL